MGVTTGIAWCDATWNPFIGCSKVSEGCDHCYMFRERSRRGQDPLEIRQTGYPRLDLPLRKTRDGEWKIPPGSFVFVCSWSDLWHEKVDAHGWREEAFRIMYERTDLTFLLLTKRIERVSPVRLRHWEDMSHIWLGVTAENQARADERIPLLLNIDWPGKRFVSIEPQLGPVDVSRWMPPFTACNHYDGRCTRPENSSANTFDPTSRPGIQSCRTKYCIYGKRGIDWVICGGESGAEHRPFDLDWARSLRDECQAADVPFFLKQYSANRPESMPLLDGKRWAERPAAFHHGDTENTEEGKVNG